MSVFLLAFLVRFLLHFDYEIAVLVEVNIEIIFCHSRGSELEFITVFIF